MAPNGLVSLKTNLEWAIQFGQLASDELSPRCCQVALIVSLLLCVYPSCFHSRQFQCFGDVGPVGEVERRRAGDGCQDNLLEQEELDFFALRMPIVTGFCC